MLSSKMSADEEEAVMKELARLQAEFVSNGIGNVSCLLPVLRSGSRKHHRVARCSDFGTRLQTRG